jgi:putative heme degradation protein
MNPDSIELSNLTKSFEYAKFSNQVDNIDNMNDLKTLVKCYFKLYLKQQEIISEWSVSKP